MPEFYKKWAKATLTGGFCPAFVLTSMIYSKESLSPVAGYSWLRKHSYCYNIILYIGAAMVSQLTGRYSVVVGLVSVTRPE